MMDPLYSAIAISLKASACATVISAFVGIPLGTWFAISDIRGKHLLEACLNSLLAIPTVVVGLALYTLLSRAGLLGNFGLLFTVQAIVIGQAVLATPIMISYTASAISGVDSGARETAVTLGAGRIAVLRVLIVEARYGIFAGVAAAFGRLIGEVGVSMMLGGNIFGVTRTMTTAIALETSKGEFMMGLKLGGILLALALFVNFILRYFRGRIERWSFSRA